MTNNDLVYSVNAGNDSGMASISNDYSFPALSPLALGTWLQNRMPNLEVIARDGAVRTNEQIKEEIARLKPGLVGVSVLCTSYQNSLDIAKTARESGAKVVFGNDQASQTSRLTLEHQPNIDYIIGAEFGEVSLELLVRTIRGEDIPLDKIPSLTFRTDGKVRGFDFHNPLHRKANAIGHSNSGYAPFFQLVNIGGKSLYSKNNALDIFPIPNRNLYPLDHWNTYLENYLGKFAEYHLDDREISELRNEFPRRLDESHSDFLAYRKKAVELAKERVVGVTTMNRARGCNRQGDDMCLHCDLDTRISRSSAEKFWEEVLEIKDQLAPKIQPGQQISIYECCDSFSSFPGLIRDIVRAKPSNLGFDPRFYVYAQARDLAEHPERIDLLKEMGVFRINCGLESMCDETLKYMKGEKDSVEKNWRFLELCKDAGIKVYSSFVLGSEKETPRTLKETVSKVQRAIKGGYLCDAEAQPVLPLHGNYQGQVLRSHGLMHGDAQHPDWPINVEDLSEIYIDGFSGVSHRDCVEAAKTIRNTARQYGINFGSCISREDSYK